MAIVLHGVLFRGGAEGHIRQYLIKEKNYLDAVGMPANIFYGTSIPTCILVLKKKNRCQHILFIDASQHFEKVKPKTYCAKRTLIKSLALKIVPKKINTATLPLSEVETNDYNLNIPRYVDTFEEEEAIDLKAITTELRELAVLADTTDATIEGFVQN
jgi:type I restriction enzyme M protein